MLILVINSGSSTIKFKVFEKKKNKLTEVLQGFIDAINQKHSALIIESKNYHKKIDAPIKNHHSGIKKLFQTLIKEKLINNIQDIKIVAHRIVHGGDLFTSAELLTTKKINKLKQLNYLAPLHNPNNIEGIKSCQKHLPHALQIGVFDTAFHCNQAEHIKNYALPSTISKKYSIKKYGFHGISHNYLSRQAKSILKKHDYDYKNLITCHIGNGVSVNATLNGKSLENSMGFTPLEGAVMGTRSGSIDPAIPLFLKDYAKLSTQKINHLLNYQSGLLGVSQASSDMRIILEGIKNKKPKQILAFKMYCQKIAQQIAALSINLKKIDAIIFTAGIGENSAQVRKSICEHLRVLGVTINSTNNKKNNLFINNANSAIKLLIIPANEELEIARQSLKFC